VLGADYCGRFLVVPTISEDTCYHEVHQRHSVSPSYALLLTHDESTLNCCSMLSNVSVFYSYFL
jgi:hypothetical protein